MARTADPHSATSQFFINHKDNGFLNHTGEDPQVGVMQYLESYRRNGRCRSNS